MSKKLPILMLLMALFAPLAVNAQETLTVYDGTTTSSYVPAYMSYFDDFSRSQFVIPASNLEIMGDGTINSIKFYTTDYNVPYTSVSTVDVFLMEVNYTTMTALESKTNGTIVYQGTLNVISEGSGGSLTINFSTPYNYGGGNLLIGIENTTDAGYKFIYFYGQTVSGASFAGYNSSSLSNVTGSQQNFIPKTTFTYETAASSCPRPTNLTVSNITSTGATFTWNGTSDSYLVMVKESSQAESANYTYDFEDGWQGWSTFQGNTTSPNSWMHNTAYPTSNNDFSTGYGYNNSDGFMLSESYISGSSSGAGQAVTPDNYLVSPQVPLGGSISFYAGARNTEYCAEKFSVMVSTTDNTNPASFTTVGTWTLSLSSAGYTSSPYTVDLSAYSGMGYVAIRHFDCYDQWFLAVDDITIDTGGESPWTTYPASASPFTINDLNPGASYDVKVIGICDGEESNASTTINFTTDIACPAPTEVNVSNITGHEATVTWTGSSESYIVSYRTSSRVEFINADFESGSLPDGWTIQGNNTWSVGTGDYSESTGAHDGDHNALITHNESDEETYLITKAMNLNGRDNLTLSLWYINRSWAGDTDGFGIYYRINGGAWNEIFATTASHSGWTHFNVTLPSGAYAANCQIGFKFTDNYGYGVGLDDIILEGLVETSEWQSVSTTDNVIVLTDLTSETLYEVVVQGDCGEEGMSAESEPVTFTTEVSCPAPTNLIVSDIDAHGATVRWDRVADTDNPTIYFQFVCVEHGEIPDWTDAPVAIDRPTNPNPPTGFFSGLAPDTEYDAYIRRICGTISPSGIIDGEFSAPAIITFTTTVACPAPTDVTVSNITAHEATVTWAGSSESYIVKYSMANFIGGIPEEFGTSIPSGWEMYTGLLSNGTATMASASYGWNFGTGNGVFDDHARVNIYGNYQRWLVMPATTVPAGSEFSFDLALTAYSGSNIPAPATTGTDDKFIVLISTDNMSTWTTLREWNNSGSTYVYNNIANTATGENVTIDLSTYAGQNVRIAFYGESTESNADNNLHIDNVAINTIIPIGEWQTVTTEEVSVTLTGLDPETLYEVVVQGDCGEEGLSSESIPVTFTTEVSCPAPSDINVSDITGHEATVTWTGSSNSYNVMYRTAALYGISEEFNSNSVPTSWAKYSGLVDNVIAGTEALSTTTSGWNSTSYALGDYNMKVNVYGTTCKYWLVTPEVALGNGFDLNFDLALTDYGNSNPIEDATAQSDDRFIVLIYTDNAWHILREWNNSGSSYVYNTIATTGQNVSINLSAYTGKIVKIAFYCESTISGGDNDLHIDNVTIGFPVAAGEWQTVTTEEASVTLTGLDPETLYEVIIQGDCGDEGMSAESEPVTFITDVTCPAPHDLRTSDVTSNSAMLHWEGAAESYNVSYYKAYFFDSFEEDLSQWTIIKDGDDGSFEWGIENPHDNSADLNAHSGSYAAVAYSNIDVHADSWLITPQITMPTQATLKFWVMRSTYDDAQDEYEVRLSTTGNDVPDFTTVLKEKEAANSTWSEVSIDLSAYDGQQCYIAIRHDFTGGFFIMVDDFGIYGWSEDIVTTDNSLLIEDLLPETAYQWHVQANCGEEDGLSQWSNIGTFTTLKACPVPFDLTATEVTANGATIAWTGYNDSYSVWVGQLETASTNYDFEDNRISDDFINSTSYPWTVVQEGQGGGSCIKSGNSGVASSTSAIEMTVDLVMDATLSFDFWSRGEGSNDSYDWDKSRFYIDGTRMFDYANHTSWESYSTTLTAGTHTLKWEYKKDGSTNPDGDCFYVDNITIESVAVSSEMNYTATESPLLLNDASYFLPETTYLVKVKGICGDEETEYSEAITFTTLDESTKIFVIEGDWSDGDNWVPAGVPSIEQDVILRAEATVFDVAEANIITIDDAGALIIEDGGQLKTNADVEATMKKFIIGYGTDYVETNDGYYLMTLPIADPISAADAGLLTEESEYDLYSWDRTATDEEWQNNHNGIDMQNGAGYLYANQDDMEMSFTATLRNSSESIVVTPAYDEVEHGGWNLYGNPFPCEAYITTDAEDMTFYRLVGNQLELIEGAIAPLEAFFVKATAAGQTFTISREAPAK